MKCDCGIGLRPDPEMRKHYGVELHSPYCPIGIRERQTGDPFPLIEETDSPEELPTVAEWLQAGGPMRETT